MKRNIIFLVLAALIILAAPIFVAAQTVATPVTIPVTGIDQNVVVAVPIFPLNSCTSISRSINLTIFFLSIIGCLLFGIFGRADPPHFTFPEESQAPRSRSRPRASRSKRTSSYKASDGSPAH